MRKIFAVTALFISSQLLAQDSTRTMNEVIVTANKLPQKQNTTGKVVSVITKEQIEKNSGRTLSQLLNEQAGITVNGALGNLGGVQTTYLRGASSGRTLILMDGVPVNDPSMINNEFDLNLVSLNNVERIEILRGAQSTLYGSDAIGGVINIITSKANVTKPFHVKATASAGNYRTYRGNVQLYGKSGKLTYTTRYSKTGTKGFSSAYDSSGKGNFDKDGYTNDAAGGSLQYQATDALSFKSFIQYTFYKTDLDAGNFADEKDYTTKSKSLTAGGGFHFAKNNVQLTGNYQYSDIYRDYLNDSLDTPGFTKYSSDNYYGRNQFIELYSSVALGSGFTLLQGADYRYSSMNSSYQSLSMFGWYTAAFNDTSHSQSSLYASLLYSGLHEKLNVELGGRLNVHSKYGSNRTYTLNPSYSFTHHFRIFGSVATGFKAPTLYQLYGPYATTILKPEESTTYEIGFQQQHASVQNRIVYFHRNIRNGIDFNYTNYQYFNFVEQTVSGIEWEGQVQPLQGLTITANYTYLQPEEKTQSRMDFKDTAYTYLLRRPKHQFNLTAGYQFTNGLFVSASGKYVSRRYDTGGYATADAPLDAYFILSGYAAFTVKPYLKLFADAQNITNKKFFDLRGYNSIPFLINGGVTFNW